MALMRCPDCAAEVSDQAPACPRCGRPLHLGPGLPAAPPKKGMSTGMIVLIVLLVTIVPALGIMATLAIYGVRKYIANAKEAEAKNSLVMIAKDAVAAYERSAIDGKRRICPSASAPVPANRSKVSGMKYMSSPSEWQADAATSSGFACLQFEMISPQYFQYEYAATSTGFVARAHGDLNGNGVFSTYEITGTLVGDQLLIAPTVRAKNPGE